MVRPVADPPGDYRSHFIDALRKKQSAVENRNPRFGFRKPFAVKPYSPHPSLLGCLSQLVNAASLSTGVRQG
jgi:hypothetical protein